MELEILELKTAIEKLIKELYKNFSLHIKSHPPVSIEKLFSKTHALVFGIGVFERFYSSSIQTNSYNHPLKQDWEIFCKEMV